jgi:non-specific serine/threonine protein kinase
MDTAPPDSPQTTPIFGELLRRFRLAAGISQERLAERAGLSVQALSALENGRRHAPYRHTVTLLAQALGLSTEDTALLEASIVRGRVPAVVAPAVGRQDRETSPEPTIGGEAAPVVGAVQPARTNLPLALTSFIGREREQAQVQALLSAARLVTLTGAGGAGKTRLALAVAGELVSEYADGVWLVELAPLANPALVPQAVATALGVCEQPHRPLLATLIDYLKDKHLLLVLDNCEHVVAACAELAERLLRFSPDLRIVATSREGLAVPGERLYRVPSLAVPPLDQLPPPEELGRYAAVALFAARAQEHQPDFVVTAQNALAVAQICARLDGIPLAIELAAARLTVLPVEDIAMRLADRFQLLTGGPRTALPRHQTLQATLDWSYALLTEVERSLLRRLAVFAGGWSLEAAEAVCGAVTDLQLIMLEGLASLMEKSLVLTVPQAGGIARFGMLETIREYGHARLATSGETEVIRRSHALYYLELAEGAEPKLTGREQARWFAQLELEHDNLRIALRWAYMQQESEIALRLGSALGLFWGARGHLVEGREWGGKLLLLTSSTNTPGLAAGWVTSLPGEPPADVAEPPGVPQTEPQALLARQVWMRARAGVLRGTGHLALWQGDLRQARSYLEDAIALSRELNDMKSLAQALNLLGTTMRFQGEYRRAVLLYEESLALYRALGDRWGIARELKNLGETVLDQGDFSRALPLVEESVSLSRELGDTWSTACALMDLGDLAYHQDDCRRATIMYEECLALCREVGEVIVNAGALQRLGRLAQAQGAPALAMTRHREGLSLAWAVGAISLVAGSLEGVAAAAHGQGQSERAAQLLGAAKGVREARGIPLAPIDRPGYDAVITAVHAALGEAAFAAAWAEGRALALEEAVALALEEGEAPLPEQAIGPAPATRPAVTAAPEGAGSEGQGRGGHRSELAVPSGVPTLSGTRPARADRQAWALERLRTAGPLSPGAYASALGVSVDTALRDLQQLVDQELVRAAGSTKNRRYTLAGERAGHAIRRTGM